MLDALGELTRDELVAYAAKAGERITKHQIKRWRDSGLIPVPRTVRLGRGCGTASRYPAVALKHVVMLSRGRRQQRSLDAMAWFAWCEGCAITPYVRRMLLRALDERIAHARDALDTFEREIPGNPIEAAVDEPVPAGIGRVKRAFRPTLAKVLLEVDLGTFSPLAYGDNDLKKILPSLNRMAATQLKNGLTPIPIDEVLAMVTAEVNVTRLRDAVSRLSDGQLERTRDDALVFWNEVGAAAGLRSLPLPIGAFSLALIATRVSPHFRLFTAFVRAGMREKGFLTFSEALRATNPADTLGS